MRVWTFLIACGLFGCSEEGGETASSAPEPVAGDELPAQPAQPRPTQPPPSEPDPAPSAADSPDATPEAVDGPAAEAGWALGADLEPPQVVRACAERHGEGEPYQRCLTASLDGRELRAAEREQIIDAYEALGDEDKTLEHMRQFIEDYPRDRRGNRYRIVIRRAEQ